MYIHTLSKNFCSGSINAPQRCLQGYLLRRIILYFLNWTLYFNSWRSSLIFISLAVTMNRRKFLYLWKFILWLYFYNLLFLLIFVFRLFLYFLASNNFTFLHSWYLKFIWWNSLCTSYRPLNSSPCPLSYTHRLVFDWLLFFILFNIKKCQSISLSFSYNFSIML